MKKTMGEVIAEGRKAKGMTQLDLAEKMKVTDKAVSKWERDLSYPDIHSLPQLSETLGISVEQLMLMKEAQTNPKDNKIAKIVDLVFKGVALAMGIAVVTLTILNALDVQTGILLLGIGLTCVAISMLEHKN